MATFKKCNVGKRHEVVDKVKYKELDDEGVFVLVSCSMAFQLCESFCRPAENHIENVNGDEVGQSHSRCCDDLSNSIFKWRLNHWLKP